MEYDSSKAEIQKVQKTVKITDLIDEQKISTATTEGFGEGSRTEHYRHSSGKAMTGACDSKDTENGRYSTASVQ